LHAPNGVAVNSKGDVYISNCGSGKIYVIKKGQTQSSMSTFVTFSPVCIRGLSFDSNDTLYVAHYEENRIYSVDKSGLKTVIAGTGIRGTYNDGSFKGLAINAKLLNPEYAVVASSGDIYISGGNSALVNKIEYGTKIFSTVAGGGSGGLGSGSGGKGTSAFLGYTSSVAVDTNDNLYIADFTAGVVWFLNTTSNIIKIVAGKAGGVGSTVHGSLATSTYLPAGNRQTTYDPIHNLLYLVFDDYRSENVIRTIDLNNGIITLIAGIVGGGGYADGPGSSALFGDPRSLAIDPTTGKLYIAENGNRVRGLVIDFNTRVPTVVPSIKPTNPTHKPSSQPSSQPLMKPSRQPYKFPSSQPSDQPNCKPSSQPYFHPSNQPTNQPRSLPTNQPTRIPSTQPSQQPTLQPSLEPSYRNQYVRSIKHTDGNIYATLGNNTIHGRGNTCQSTYLSLPAGWIVAVDSPIVRSLIAKYTWDTTVLLVNNGKGYYTKFSKSKTPGTQFVDPLTFENSVQYSGIAWRNTGGKAPGQFTIEYGPLEYSVIWCSIVNSQILIMQAPAVATQPRNYFDYQGMRYATLQDLPYSEINIKLSERTNQNNPVLYGHGSSTFLPVPSGWSVASSAPLAVTTYSWNCRALCFTSGPCILSNVGVQYTYADAGIGSSGPIMSDGNGRWALNPSMIAKTGPLQIMISAPVPTPEPTYVSSRPPTARPSTIVPSAVPSYAPTLYIRVGSRFYYYYYYYYI
jgi:hypothetical protein